MYSVGGGWSLGLPPCLSRLVCDMLTSCRVSHIGLTLYNDEHMQLK